MLFKTMAQYLANPLSADNYEAQDNYEAHILLVHHLTHIIIFRPILVQLAIPPPFHIRNI